MTICSAATEPELGTGIRYLFATRIPETVTQSCLFYKLCHTLNNLAPINNMIRNEFIETTGFSNHSQNALYISNRLISTNHGKETTRPKNKIHYTHQHFESNIFNVYRIPVGYRGLKRLPSVR